MSEIKALVSEIHKFCRNTILPVITEDDEEGRFRLEIFQAMGELGITGVTTPEKYDGAELGYQDFCQILATVAHYSVPYAVTISVSSMCQAILNQFGTEKQKQTYLPALAAGREIGAFALSESEAGSDAASLKTTAKKTAEGYVLKGTKMWITSAGVAKTYIVMARTGGEGGKGISAFVVRDGTKGFTYGKAENKMGWRTSPTRELIFDNCLIPHENLIGEEGEGLAIALAGLDRGRITIGAIACGLAQSALNESVTYALERKQFKQAIFDFQGLQFMLAEMATEIEASRLLVQEAARLYDFKTPNQKLSSMAKLKATDTAMYVTTEAVQILGGVGYTKEFPVERFMRDAKVMQILEGTNQIQKVVIARNLKKEFER